MTFPFFFLKWVCKFKNSSLVCFICSHRLMLLPKKKKQHWLIGQLSTFLTKMCWHEPKFLFNFFFSVMLDYIFSGRTPLQCLTRFRTSDFLLFIFLATRWLISFFVLDNWAGTPKRLHGPPFDDTNQWFQSMVAYFQASYHCSRRKTCKAWNLGLNYWCTIHKTVGNSCTWFLPNEKYSHLTAWTQWGLTRLQSLIWLSHIHLVLLLFLTPLTVSCSSWKTLYIWKE